MTGSSGSLFKTVTVIHSWPLARPDGSTALLLQTKEEGCIAFRVDAQAIELSRKQLTDCEIVLSRAMSSTQQH
jgi:hypothetical protein